MAYFIDITTRNEKSETGYIRSCWRDLRFSDKKNAIVEAYKALKDTKDVIMVEVFEEGLAKPILILDSKKE